MTYKFNYKRKGWFYHTEKVVGHNYMEKQNKMVLYYEDGSIREIKEWNKCECKLGTDWVLAVQKKMEKDTGTPVPVNVGS